MEGQEGTSLISFAFDGFLQHVRIGHVEAGPWSFDWIMPEEINRVIADHISDLLFAPTENAKALLLKDGIPESKIFVIGNTIVDTVNENLKIARDSDILEKLGVTPKGYMLSTIHRQENTDDKHRLSEIFKGLGMVSEAAGMPIILPVHPRMRKMLATFDIKIPAGVRLIDRLGFIEFLKAESNALLVLTDSGGVQEECYILGVPCVTIRENTERPETVEVGANVLAGFKSDDILGAYRVMTGKNLRWLNPFGNGKAGIEIIRISKKTCY